MALSRRQAKDQKYRKHFREIEISRLFLKAVCSNMFLPQTYKEDARILLAKLSNFKSHRIRNRCIVSDRSRSVSRAFRINRMQFLIGSGFGKMPGVRKSSW